MIRKTIYFFVLSALAFFLFVTLVVNGSLGKYEGPGEVTQKTQPKEALADRSSNQKLAKEALNIKDPKMILFGDLHVHTTYSQGAFMLSLPMLSGEGTKPPADACDFARFCSSLDFWANTDHAEDITPTDWSEIKASIRQCNKVNGSSEPDTVAFLGWEWSQIGGFGKEHYGHKNIILKGLEEDQIPARPISADNNTGFLELSYTQKMVMAAMRPTDRRIHDLMRFINDSQTLRCPLGIPVRDLPLDCRETASDPGILFDKLNDWGHEAIVVPHGTAWGVYTPPSSDWREQLTEDQHDPKIQTMVEIYSGHGNSEEYRNWRSVLFDEEGNATCPRPSKGFLPGCWQAGKIIEDRCLSEGESVRECSKRAGVARKNYANEGVAGYSTILDEKPSEWLNANQCTDCFLPAFNFRPAGSVQYMLAMRNFTSGDTVDRFRFSFIASSDNHTARPGTGYKEINRREMTEAAGVADPSALIFGFRKGPGTFSKSNERNWTSETLPSGSIEAERGASFFVTGGLMATHSIGKNRDAIWNAIKRKEVYATSGPRILLWFDLLNEPEGESVPMGSEASMGNNPRFLVKAVGSFKQKPGCPEYSLNALGPERLEDLCRNECYNPSDERKLIERLEVVRIKPQVSLNENIEQLIEDKWKVFICPVDASGCSFTFTDNEFDEEKRDTVYYVRAIEESSKAINANNLRCENDVLGNCKSTNICEGSDLLTPYEDDCLGDTQERAWSSPIYVDYSL